jgi:hypothetical protein
VHHTLAHRQKHIETDGFGGHACETVFKRLTDVV